MTQAITLIRGAFLSLGVIDANQSPDAAQTQDALTSLNDLLADWSASQLLLSYSSSQESYTFSSSVTSLTVGPSGVKVTVRPLKILNPFLRVGLIDYQIELISEAEYYAIPYKSLSGGYCTHLWYDATDVNGTFYMYPGGASGQTLYWDSITSLQTFVTSNDTVTLPPNYLRALRLNLAVELAPEYGVEPSQTLVRLAAAAKRGIKITNTAVPLMKSEAAYLSSTASRININTNQ